MLEPIENPDLVDRVYLRLRRAIHEGTLPPGARLVERQLADRLGVSRAPVRDALHMLERDGLVASAGRRGKIVATLSARDAWEVYSLRATLEAMAFRLAALQATPAAIAELESIVGEMRAKCDEGDADTLASLDMRFHEAVCRASGHGRLLWAWTAMSRQIQLLIHVDTHVAEAQYQDVHGLPARHERLLAAIRSGDDEAAETQARAHIDAVTERVISVLHEADARRTEASLDAEADATGSAVLGASPGAVRAATV
jgi:DNA-binding GntR family transcriptional regulator